MPEPRRRSVRRSATVEHPTHSFCGLNETTVLPDLMLLSHRLALV